MAALALAFFRQCGALYGCCSLCFVWGSRAPPRLRARGAHAIESVFDRRGLDTLLSVSGCLSAERTVRNLVLSICEFRLQAAPAAPHPTEETGAGGGVPGGRVGSQLLLLGSGLGSSDRGGTQLLMHGGADETQCYDDLHVIELERGLWRAVSVGGFSKPSGVYGHSMRVWNDKIVLFGGLANQRAQELANIDGVQTFPPPPFIGPQSTEWLHNPQPSNSLFLLQVDGFVWTQPDVDGEVPTPRAFHGATICKDFLVVFGGATDARLREPSNDLYLLDLLRSTWHCPSSFSAKKRRAGEGLEIETESGGAAREEAEDESESAPVVRVSGTPPSPRLGHAMVTVKQTEKILLFGGVADDTNLYCLDFEVYRRARSGASRRAAADDDDEVSELSLAWSCIETHRTGPVSRGFFTFAQVGPGRLFIFGGQPLTSAAPDASSPADLYVLNLKTYNWQKPLYEGQLSLRAEAAAVLHDKLIVFGGARVSPKAPAASGAAEGEATGPARSAKPSALGNEGEGALSSLLGASSSCRISKKLFFLNVLEIKEGAGGGEFRFKLVTVGDSGVGKSCLLMRFVQDQYSDFHVSTIGVDFKSVVTMVKGKVCTLQLWDTAGQERFSGVTGNYYRNADCFVLVFDATRRSTFLHIDSWIKQIKEHHDCGLSTIMLLIGNKADLSGTLEVSEQEAREFADGIGAIYVSTSAKTSANVDAAFLAAATKLVDMRRRAAAGAASAAASATSAAPAAASPLPAPARPGSGISLLPNALGGSPLSQRRAGCAGACAGGGGGLLEQLRQSPPVQANGENQENRGDSLAPSTQA
ncbi:Ras family protein [Besnoitia besnoiti]|uniref:Ras family protein n=1 Tax=Besnoitia besnoiti TaxID=94643 RepID=A0A2A9MLG8_BESBE|nr:Ras family protein [Besnoitia besnoiti]PFH38104.1 Ras family protein [Besnoitia besnoiti]